MTNTELREKLVELIRHSGVSFANYPITDVIEEAQRNLADHLIANGVLIAPCKIGDDIWWINEKTNTVECCKSDVTGFAFVNDGVLIRDKAGDYDKPGTTWCFLTRKDAEDELERRLHANALYNRDPGRP